MRSSRFLPLVFAFCLSFVRSISAQSTPISLTDIQADFDAQRYQEVIKKAAQALQMKGPAAANLDKGKLQTLKAESHLRLKQITPAAEAFTAAAREVTDPKELAMDKAMAMLIRRSPGGQYQPKQPTTQSAGARGARPSPIGIIEPESRKQALMALFNDELKVVTPKIEALAKQQSLPPLMAGIKQVDELRAVELAGSGSDTQCKELFSGLEQRAGQLMTAAIKSMSDNVEKISRAANQLSYSTEPLPDGGGSKTIVTKRGLNSSDISALNEVVETTKSIVAACDDFTKAMQTSTGSMAMVNADAAKLLTKADQALKADYSPKETDAPPPRSGTRGRAGQSGYGN